MVDVCTDIEIAKPIAEVAAFAQEPANAPRWYVNIKSVEWLTTPPLQLGSRIAFMAQFLGRKLSYTYEITDFVALERLVMRTAQGPFPMETTYTWVAIDERHTRMTLRNRGQPNGFARVTAPLLAGAMRRANQKDLSTLKRLLERGDQA